MGLELLLLDKERIKVRDFVDRFKLALIAHDPNTWVEEMFPEWVDKSTDDEGQTVEYIKEVSDHDLMSPEGGEWRFEEKVTPEEAEKILAEMTQNPQGSFGIGDMEDDEGWV